MHDPMTVAFEIRYPWRKYKKSTAGNDFERTYRESKTACVSVDEFRDFRT